MCSPDFTRLNTDVDGCIGNCAQTAVLIPRSPPRIAICSEPDPTQWPNAWTSSRPVSSRTLATAAGQSMRAMSSIVNSVRADGRSMPAR